MISVLDTNLSLERCWFHAKRRGLALIEATLENQGQRNRGLAVGRIAGP
jgi:hypothetical protein